MNLTGKNTIAWKHWEKSKLFVSKYDTNQPKIMKRGTYYENYC